MVVVAGGGEGLAGVEGEVFHVFLLLRVCVCVFVLVF